MFGTFVWLPLMLWHLATGWIRHLFVNFPHLGWDPGTVALSAACLVLAVFLLHRFFRGVSNREIHASVTVHASVAFLAACAAAIAMTGIVHELAWLARSPVIVSNRASARTMAISNAKQLHLVLLELADRGVHPRSIDEVIEHCPEARGISTYPTSSSSHARERFVLLQPGKDLLSLAPDVPVIGAMGLASGEAIVVSAYGSTSRMTTAEVEALLSSEP